MINIVQKKKLIDFFIEEKIFLLGDEKSSAVPYRVFLNRLCSYPTILSTIAHLFGDRMKQIPFDLIAGPYTDIPLATTISLEFAWPMIFVRSERKDHGMERLIEGNFQLGQRVFIVDDEVSDVEGTLQLIGRLEGSGLSVEGLFVLLDRENGTLESIRKRGYRCESLLSINDILINLLGGSKITSLQREHLELFFKTHRRDRLVPQITPTAS